MGERAPGALCCRFKPGAYHRHPVLLSLPGQRCYWCDYRDILSNCRGPDMPMSSQTPFSCAHGPGQANSCTVRIVYRTHSSLVSGQSQMLHFDDCYLLKHCSPSPFESAHIPSSRGQRTFSMFSSSQCVGGHSRLVASCFNFSLSASRYLISCHPEMHSQNEIIRSSQSLRWTFNWTFSSARFRERQS